MSVRPNQTLHLTGAAILVSREIKVLQAAPERELCRSLKMVVRPDVMFSYEVSDEQ